VNAIQLKNLDTSDKEGIEAYFAKFNVSYRDRLAI